MCTPEAIRISIMGTPQYIHAGWLIDGTGGPVQEKILMRIDKGMITAIDRFDPNSRPDPALVIDLSRCTILPPFVDSHVHLTMSGTTDRNVRNAQLTTDGSSLDPVIGRHIRYLFQHGVLAVRDGGDRNGCLNHYLAEHTDREPVIVKTAGRAWHRQGRYGRLIGRYPAPGQSLAEACQADNAPVDFIKLVNSGLNSLSNFGKETPPQFNLEEIRALVLQAEQKGCKVMVHANGKRPVEIALQAGCHSIEHGFFMGRDNLEQMAANQVVWVPTAYTMKAYAENIDPGDPQSSRTVAEQNLEHQLQQINLARQLGVTIALGTDAGSIGVLHGESLVEELKLLIKAGYTLTEAIKCATSNGAMLLGLKGYGFLVKGRPAHFLIARATPAMLPRKLSYLEGIYINGRPCSTNHYQKI